MTTFTDTSAIFNYHRGMLDLYGSQSSYALGWRDVESQRIRFEAIAQIADLNHHSVLDAGCGYADLWPFLLQCYPAIKQYVGVEIIPELIDTARDRYGNTGNVEFISVNFLSADLPQADYVLASGSLNYSSIDADFIYNAIEKLYSHCQLGLGFNLLRKINGEGLLAVYDQQDIYKFCCGLSDKVILKEDYAKEDFTIFMYRNPA